MAESLFISKARYGLQLMGEVRWTNAQMKLTEIWKAVNDESHPFKIEVPKINLEEKVSRGQMSGYIKSKALTNITKKTFINDVVKNEFFSIKYS